MRMEGVVCRPISGFYSGIDGFSNNDHLQFYYNHYPPISRSRSGNLMGVRCAVKMEKRAVVEQDCAMSAMVDEKNSKKMMKKRSKLLKRLSGDLAMFSSSGDIAAGLLLDLPINQEWKDASEALLSQLKKLKSEQKELKKKMKEEKSKSRATDCFKKTMKAKIKAADCASTSSSSSSESSDSECEGEVLDMSRRKHETNALPMSSLTLNEENLKLQSSTMIQEKAPPSLASLTDARNQENMGISEQDSSNMLLSLLEKEKEAMEKKKIEVCMGGKCKRSGAGALLDEFQKVAGATAPGVEVVGCKCMGKCRDGPNVRLVSPLAIDCFDHDDELLHHNHCQVVMAAAGVAVADPPSVMTRRKQQRPSYPLCIGVGLDDVGFIVSKFVGDQSGVAV